MKTSGARISEGEEIYPPSVYNYHDYRQFLDDWFQHHKRHHKVSLRKVADEAHVSASYVSMILSGSRNLSQETLEKLAPVLGLDKNEEAFLGLLMTISDSDSQEKRLEALNKIQRLTPYKSINKKEIEAYRYLTHWYYVVIREMVALPDFKLDPAWIQSRLSYTVPLAELTQALEFLTQNGFIKVDQNGGVTLPEKEVECFRGVYKIALAQFYKQMFSLASQSIDKTSRTYRSMGFHTVAISQEKFKEVKRILDEAQQKIAELGQKEKQPDVVYHVNLASFPLTEVQERKEEPS